MSVRNISLFRTEPRFARDELIGAEMVGEDEE
jgi:hypothetical protein